MSIINANPTVYDASLLPTREEKAKSNDVDLSLYRLSIDAGLDDKLDEDSDTDSDSETDPIDSMEIYQMIANISDPEHPLSLASLGVVNLEDISIKNYVNGLAEVVVKITPTINHCSLATLIGLGIRVRLQRCLPPRFRVKILLKEGSHQSESQVNKQLNDKERICAACENQQLLSVISGMLSTC